MSYTGHCHCGAVTFTVEAELPENAVECNCSHCSDKGLILTFVPAGQFTLDSGSDNLGEYRFNTRTIAHRFCNICGCEPFAEGTSPNGEMRAINLRCVDAADLSAIRLDPVDGASY